ncbi:MAG: helix-turn-helix transcriptional regulator [Solirubrobacterales bacterium]|nr:helix-turn-helix transcriptional regulator [Solirubrobacterales bacterium]
MVELGPASDSQELPAPEPTLAAEPTPAPERPAPTPERPTPERPAPKSELAANPAEAAPLSATGRVILGMIAKGVRSGYEIKQLVDKSTRHFWAASYGQIYPELRRLEQDGLIQGQSDPSGARARMAYALTPRGEQALRDWLLSEHMPVYELRDEAMLKLFFSDLEPGSALQAVRAIRALHERKHEQLSQIQLAAEHMPEGPRLDLQIGLGVTTWLIEWARTTEERLTAEEHRARADEHRATDDASGHHDLQVGG